MIIDDAGGLVFRPPSEARSFILRVTIGCSHNTCRFCNMYKASKFRIRPLEEIEGIIERGAEALPFIRRIFLADGDALVLPTDTLVAIMKKCYEKFPKLTRIGAYATPADLIRKTPEELKRLREAGLAIEMCIRDRTWTRSSCPWPATDTMPSTPWVSTFPWPS